MEHQFFRKLLSDEFESEVLVQGLAKRAIPRRVAKIRAQWADAGRGAERLRAMSIAALTVCFLLGCEKGGEPPSGKTTTLSTGIKVVSVGDCTPLKDDRALVLNKRDDGYVLSATTPLNCEKQVDVPYLTPSSRRAATLVLSRGDRSFHSDCNCPRPIEVLIEKRLVAGDILYVLNDDEVLGHLVVP